MTLSHAPEDDIDDGEPVTPPPGKKLTSAQQQIADRASQMILYEGASIGQLAILFHKDKRTISKEIAGKVKPCGKRAGYPVYAVVDAAPFLVTPAGDIEAYIKKMHHDDLPPLLNKNFWAGQREKQRFQIENGELLPTSDVLEMLASVFKNMSLTIQLFSDTIERETKFTDQQRETLQREVDALLREMKEKLVDEFADDPRSLAAQSVVDDVADFDREAFSVSSAEEGL